MPPLVPRPRPRAPKSRDPQALAPRWVSYYPRGNTMAEGPAVIYLGRGNEVQTGSATCSRTHSFNPQEAQRAGGRSWKAVPGRGEGGLCIPMRLPRSGQLRATEIPPLTVLGGPVIREPRVCSLLVDCRQLSVAPGLWTHHPLCLTTGPLPVCLCPHIILP